MIYNAKASGKLEKAAGKMEERFLGRSTPDEPTIERWNAVAAEVIRLQITDPRSKGTLLQRADEILQEVGAEAFAYLSSTSPLGFGQRLRRFGKDLACTLEGKGGASLEDLTAARVEIGEHVLAAPGAKTPRTCQHGDPAGPLAQTARGDNRTIRASFARGGVGRPPGRWRVRRLGSAHASHGRPDP